MSMTYHTRPSEIVGLEHPYEAFCFDEACSYIRDMIVEEEVEPVFGKESKKTAYPKFSDMYADILN